MRGAWGAVLLLLMSGCLTPGGGGGAETDSVPDGSHPQYGYPVADGQPERTPSPTASPSPTATPSPSAAPSTTSTTSTAPSTGSPSPTAEPEPQVPDSWQKPPKRPLPDELSGLQHVAATEAAGVTDGAGIAVWGHHAFVGDYSPAQLWVLDIMDPEQPQVVAHVEGIPMRDADVIGYPDGRLILASASGGSDITLTDVTDPASPRIVGTIQTVNTNHNLATVPGTPIVYNAPSSGSNIDIWDVSDPSDPQLVQDWNNGAGCHDIYFHVDNAGDLYRGYCAGIDDVQIWDITDAAHPTIVHEFPFPAFGVESAPAVSPVSFAHLAFVNHDASVLILGDETAGGAGPGCDVYAEAAGTTLSGPAGNLYFYDLSDETAPVRHGQVSPSATEATTSCTAHFGRTIEDRDDLVMAFYTAGVLLVNFTDLDAPRIVDQWNPGADTWDAWYYQGYVFTGDRSRGLDVLTFV